MVFESVAVAFLNSFLGSYVENLDSNQLKLGIFSGDAVFQNLIIKQSAIADLDLPIQAIHGKIGKLSLRIPWHSLYSAPYVINIEDVYLLAVPNQQVVYDPMKEEKKEIEAKKRELMRIEAAKKLEEEAAASDAPKQDTFVEKAIAQAIKNAQVNIKRIHIRYEDCVSNPGKPFSLGITLGELDIISTDEHWLPAVGVLGFKAFKVLKCECLAFYWNCGSERYSELAAVDIIKKMSNDIANKQFVPNHLTYVLGPINAAARLRMNQKPEQDDPPFSVPVYHFNFDMEKLFIGVSKLQYRDIITMSDSMNRMTLGIPYRKYRPHVDSYRGHYKEWWHFAFNCVLEEEVRRKRRNWNWDQMAAHRKLCKEYSVAYQKKLRRTETNDDKRKIEEAERKLNLFNIVIIRQQIELEEARLVKQMKSESKSWFGWMWGGSSKASKDGDDDSIMAQLQEAMTPEEKNRLYKAIDYQENATPATFPTTFMQSVFTFLLRTLEIELRDESRPVHRILFTELKSVKLRFDTRPAANAIRVQVKIDELVTSGTRRDDFVPQLIGSNTQGASGLLEVNFETNPLDKKCDQRVVLLAQPLKVVYDAETINSVIDIFTMPQSSSTLDQLSAAAGSGLTNFKEKSATGLQHAIDKHMFVDLDINFNAPYVVIPYGGKYTGFENVLVLSLGNVMVKSKERDRAVNVQHLHAQGIRDEALLKAMVENSYDEIQLKLTGVQVLIAQGGENWFEIISNIKESEMHIVAPINLEIAVFKCIIDDDPKLPAIKINGSLPRIHISVSDARLMQIISLVTSIPFNETEVSNKLESQYSVSSAAYESMSALQKYLEDNVPKPEKQEKEQDYDVQFCEIELKFIMQEFMIDLYHQTDLASPRSKLIALKIENLETLFVKKTFVMDAKVHLERIGVQHLRDSGVIDVISTPVFVDKSSGNYLFNVRCLIVDKRFIKFHSTYKSIENLLTLEFAGLRFTLNQEALVSLIAFGTDLQSQITELTQNKSSSLYSDPSMGNKRRRLSTLSADISRIVRTSSQTLVKKAEVSKKESADLKSRVVESIQVKVHAALKELTVGFETDVMKISKCSLKGVHAEVIVKSSYTQVEATLLEIEVTDLNPKTIHHMVLSVQGDQALKFQLVMHNLREEETDKPNMAVRATMGGLRIVFLNWFVTNMLNFLNNFQEAQNKIIEASEAAAENVKKTAQDAITKATKISLDIDIKAPDIIVPVNSTSHEALFLDLGYITMKNSFTKLDVKNTQDNHAEIDHLSINLTDFKLSRVKLGKTLQIAEECVLLKPLNINMTIKRNLSTAWYRAVPDVMLAGKFNTISVELSDSDYHMVMRLLSENLPEGQPVAPPQPTHSKTFFPDQSTLASVQVETALETTLTDLDPQVYIIVDFKFSMEKFIVQLFAKGPQDLAEAVMCHIEENSLGRFSLEGLSIKGRMLSDNSIVTSVLLVNCRLDDTRKGREGKLNRLIYRKQEDNEQNTSADQSTSSSESLTSVKSMIDVTLNMKDSTMFLDVRIYSFVFILSMEYLLKIQQFFTKAVEDSESSPAVEKTASTIASKTEKTAAAVVDNVQSKTVLAKPVAQTAKNPDSRMTINLKIEKPDIILLEHMDNMDTNALFLQCQIILKFRMIDSHQVISGSLNDLQLFTASYNPVKRLDTKCNVLDPVTVSVAGSTPENKGLHVEVIFTDIRLKVTPVTIELLSRISASLSSSASTEKDTVEEVANNEDIWVEKPYDDDDYWFLRTEVAAEATEELAPKPSLPENTTVLMAELLEELCIVSMPNIVFTIEAGVGNKTLPMLLLQSGFKGHVRNWSSQLNVDAGLTLEMGYYNSALALWEPVIEPIEVVKNGKTDFIPWELRLEVSLTDQEDPSSPTDSNSQLCQPVTTIDLKSEHNLELTVTKTFLVVVSTLQKCFASAVEKKEEIAHQDEFVSPYKVVNNTGIPIKIKFARGAFRCFAEPDSNEAILEPATEVPLQLKNESDGLANTVSNSLRDCDVKNINYLHVDVESKNCELDLPVTRSDKRFFLLNYRGDCNDNWGLISDVQIVNGISIITLRSILQIYNHFHIPIEVYYMTEKGNEVEWIGTVKPDGFFNIPLKAVYTKTNEIFFSVDDYSVTTTPYIWKDLQTNLSVTKLLNCKPKEADTNEDFIIQAVGELEQVYYESTTRHTMTSTCYNIHLRPAVTFKNFLPIDVICCVDNTVDEKTAKAGETIHLPNVNPSKSAIIIKIPEYLEKQWSCRHEFGNNPPEFTVLTLSSYDSAVKMGLDLGLNVVNKSGSLIATLYCPFWMLNKTGLFLSYRKSKKVERQESSSSTKSTDDHSNILYHPANFKGPILFSFSPKNFFGKKKASIKVETGEWSDKFSLDVAGSSGVVTCKKDDTIYQIGVHNQLTYSGFTKQVTFTPYHVIINNAPFGIECQEYDRPADPWIHVDAKSCSALWPFSVEDDRLLHLRVVGTREISVPFLYTESHTTLLKLDNKYGGINVDIQITEGAFYINLTAYDVGMAPALIINHTRDTMNYWEKESVQVRHLQSRHSVLYTWENPAGPRIFSWETYNKKELENDLRKDGVGEYSIAEDYKIYWVSFLFGMQRVLLFTEDKSVAEDAQSAKQFELVQQEITVSLHGLGFSLVNNEIRQEIMYVGVASSGIIWETCKMKGQRFKQMSQKDSQAMEVAYNRYLSKLQTSPEGSYEGHEIVDSKTEVDFAMGHMLRPHKRHVRRTFQTGLWVQMKTSPSQMQLHAKVNRLQIDNQMQDCVFPIVLAPVPPPKSVAIDAGIKPFAEVSIVQLLVKNSQIKQFKYFKVLIQEFHVKVDIGFITALTEMQTKEQTEEEEMELFLLDMKLVDEPLYAHVSTQSLQEQKSFYDLLHFSPLKIHISFSMSSGGVSSADQLNFLNVLLQGLGVTLTDLNDVVFKLAYFERDYTFFTQRQLLSETQSHYVGQLIKQLYVLVLGLDVIGNPYGLVVGITQGVEDLFYEPFQGAIQGPGEFAEGLVLGVKSLFGHTVGGAAGAVSKITGAMGKGIAALTFDKEYQRKRRDQLNKKPATVQEGIARSGKGLVMGVVDGVTGVFTKPISGAKEEGVEGFFKGLGKGCMGLVARPTAGVIDFASGSLDAVKRVTEASEDVLKLRPPRFLPADGLVKPYTRFEAEGHKMLIDLEKGRFASTDAYVVHYAVIEKKEFLMLTDKRIFYITHNDLFGSWQIEWSYTWTELQHPVKVCPKGVQLVIGEGKKKKLGLFSSNETTKVILISDPAKREEIGMKIESLRGP